MTTTCVVPFSNAWRERLTEKRTGTSLCGWCIGPPGVQRPHRFGIEVAKCRCGCHRKGRRIEAATAVAEFMERGGYGSEEVPNEPDDAA